MKNINEIKKRFQHPFAENLGAPELKLPFLCEEELENGNLPSILKPLQVRNVGVNSPFNTDTVNKFHLEYYQHD